MPLTPTGKEVYADMIKHYGRNTGREIFYKTINAKKKGSEKWHLKKKHE